MIQRIQTIYLILIAGIMLAMLFLPIGEPVTIAGTSFDLGNSWVLKLIYGLTALISAITIFFYKKRSLQISLCIGIFILLVLSYVAFYFLIWQPNKEYLNGLSYSYAIILPLVALILDILAILGVKKDEKLVRSLDRLR